MFWAVGESLLWVLAGFAVGVTTILASDVRRERLMRLRIQEKWGIVDGVRFVMMPEQEAQRVDEWPDEIEVRD